ncbi:MAG: DNA-3-methyladenine glycosylase family protein [Promethearchaeota archaeon]
MKLKCKIFDLDQSLSCGQVFRWIHGNEQWWYGVINNHIVKISQNDNELEFYISPKISDPKQFILNYFRLEDDLELIYQQISKDIHMKKAIRCAYGLHIIRQNPWECMISYIISQQNQIPKIKRSLEILSQKFGTCYSFEGKKFYTFPTPEQLSKAKLSELQKGFDHGGCALGYRSKYVLSSTLLIHNKSLSFSLEDLKYIPYEDANKLLQDSFCGIGPKVADCILLFSLDKLEAFPLDTWIRKIILKLYLKKKDNDKKIREFCSDYFGKFAGYAQEYLYSNRLKFSP